VPLAFGLGEAYQFDWSEEGLVIAGVYRRLQVAHMKLAASRAFWLGAYPTKATRCCSMRTRAASPRWASRTRSTDSGTSPADQMGEAGPQRGGREDGAKRLTDALQAVGHRDQDVDSHPRSSLRGRRSHWDVEVDRPV